MEADAYEFPFIDDLPKREKNKLVELWDTVREFNHMTKQKGVLLPQTLAAKMLKVSKQRVHELGKSGRLERVELAGYAFVTELSVIKYAESERRTGRPAKHPLIA